MTIRFLAAITALALVTPVEAYQTPDPQKGVESQPQYVSPAGQKYFAQSDAQGLVKEAQKKVDADPKNVTLLIALGDANATIWNHKEAIRVYDRAFALDPDNATLYQQRGHRYLSIREFAKARADLEKAAAMDPKLLGAWYYLGVLDYVEGRFEKAASDFEKNLTLQDDDVAKAIGTVDWLYMSYRRGKQDEKAKALLARVTPDLKIEGNPRLYFNRTLFYKGLKTENELIALASNDVERTTLGYGIGNFHLVSGDTAKARAPMEMAVRLTAWTALAFIAAERDLSRLP